RRCRRGPRVVARLLGLQLLQHRHAVLAHYRDPEVELAPVDALRRSAARVHQHQSVEAFWVPKGRDLGNHPAHRDTEQHEALPAEGVGQRPQVVGEQVEVVGVLGRRLLAVAMAAQVGGYRVPPGISETVDGLGEVVLGTGEPVHQQHPPLAGAALAYLDGNTAGVDGAHIHQRPPLLPVRAPRSTTWPAGGTTACTGTPKSNRSIVNVTLAGAPGVEAAVFDLLRSTA